MLTGILETGSGEVDFPPTTLTTDQLLEALTTPRRRRTIRIIDDFGRDMRIGELSERVASLEYGIPASQLSSKQRKRVYVGLYQCHIPKVLAPYGVIEWQSNRGIVAPSDETHAVRVRLEALTAGTRVVGGAECELCDAEVTDPAIGGSPDPDEPDFVVCQGCRTGVL